MTAAPEPRPTLLASMGVSGGAERSPAATDQIDGAAAGPARPRLRATRRASSSPRVSGASDDRDLSDTVEGVEALPAVLDRIRQRHRDRRISNTRTPLAPLNVDLPLELLDHVRQVSQDIPYPLRRLAEEAIELWLEATGNVAEAEGSADSTP